MKFFSILLTTLFFLPCFAKATNYNSDDGIFINGYDPVSYQVQNKAIKGKSEINYSYNGVKILFSSQENKNKFIKNTKKMIPAYKGWCAYAMAGKGELVKINPKTFKIINGKTYLFYNKGWTNTLKKWNKKPDAPQIKIADSNWQTKFSAKK